MCGQNQSPPPPPPPPDFITPKLPVSCRVYDLSTKEPKFWLLENIHSFTVDVQSWRARRHGSACEGWNRCRPSGWRSPTTSDGSWWRSWASPWRSASAARRASTASPGSWAQKAPSRSSPCPRPLPKTATSVWSTVTNSAINYQYKSVITFPKLYSTESSVSGSFVYYCLSLLAHQHWNRFGIPHIHWCFIQESRKEHQGAMFM